MKIKKPALTWQEIRALSQIGLVVLLVVSGLVAANVILAKILRGGGGFLLPWTAARDLLFEQAEPYSGIVARQVQQAVYGRIAAAGENPYILDLPFYLLPFYFPFALTSDAALARGIWMFLSEIGLFALAFLSLRLTEWEPHRLFLTLFFLLSFLGFYSVESLLEGNLAVLLGLLYMGILLSLRTGLDELTGALIALATFKWEIGGPFLFLVLLRVFHERRWRALAGLGMLMFILLVISFLLRPDWILPFLRAVWNNLRTDFGSTSGAIFLRYWPEYGARLGWVLTGLLVVILGFEWHATQEADFRHFFWASCLTLAATPLIGFRTEISNLVALLPGLTFIFVVAFERWYRLGYWLSGMLLFVSFAAPWGLFVRGFFTGRSMDDLLFLFLPVFTLLGLYWIRWWVLRPPRTWLDRVARLESR